MPEIRTKLIPFRVEMLCDECHRGTLVEEIKSWSDCVLRIPQTWPHVCQICGNREDFEKKYPYISYDDVYDE